MPLEGEDPDDEDVDVFNIEDDDIFNDGMATRESVPAREDMIRDPERFEFSRMKVQADLDAISEEERGAIVEHVFNSTKVIYQQIKNLMIEAIKGRDCVLRFGDLPLHMEDILSLKYMGNGSLSSWFTDNLIQILFKLEMTVGVQYAASKLRRNAAEVCHFDSWNLFLSTGEDFEVMYKDDIQDGIDAKTPSFGWPMADMTAEHKRVLFEVNPIGNHWMVLEIVLGDIPRVILYDSMSEISRRSKNVLQRDIPHFLQHTSMRPGSPLAGIEWTKIQIEVAECPQQGYAGVDCGPHTVYMLTQRLYDLPLARTLPQSDEEARHTFSQNLRAQCVKALCMYKLPKDSEWVVSLRLLFAALESGNTLCVDESSNESDGDVRVRDVTRTRRSDRKRTVISYRRDSDSDSDGHDSDDNCLSGSGLVNPTSDVILSEPSQFVNVGEVISRTGFVISNPTLGEALTLDEQNLSFPSNCPGPWRFALTKSRQPKSFVMAIRYSGTNRPRDMKTFLKNKERDAKQWFSWLKSITDTAHTVDNVVVTVGLGVRTRYAPALDLPERDHSFHLPVIHCPICPYTSLGTYGIAYSKPFFLHLSNHFTQGHVQVYKRKGEFQAKCPSSDCNSSPITGKNREKVISNLRSHYSIQYCANEAERRGETLKITCNRCDDKFSTQDWTEGTLRKIWEKICPKEQCPLCPKKSPRPYDISRHIQIMHRNDALPTGYHRCEHLLPEVTQTWDEIFKADKEWARRYAGRIFREDGRCAWFIAGMDNCSTHSPFQTPKALLEHYDRVHKHDIWPLSQEICGSIHQTKKTLVIHWLRKRHETVENKNDRFYRNLAKRFTSQIITDLYRAREHQPVLLSIGIDGFTCNSELMANWLQDIGFDFNFFWISKMVRQLDQSLLEQGMTTCGKAVYCGQYSPSILMAACRGSTTVPPKYADLVQWWNLKQNQKDLEASHSHHRNTAVRHHMTENENESESDLTDIDEIDLTGVSESDLTDIDEIDLTDVSET